MNKRNIVVAVVAVLLVLGGWAWGRFQPVDRVIGAAGGLLAENYLPFVMYNGGYNTAKSIKTTGDLTVGESGNALTMVKSGTCTILSNASVAATTTANFDCAFTGVQAGDVVVASLAATSSIASQYVIKGVTASTTSGWITFSLLNLTGTSAVPSATVGFGSSTAVHILR